MNAEQLQSVLRIYEGSDGAATLRLYAQLEALGPAGEVALNLFRAQKASARAKVYRGGLPGRGSYRGIAYERKQWAMDNVCRALAAHAAILGLRWGWQLDPAQEFHQWVLYVDLPTGQVSFHTAARGLGPEYSGEWDGIPNRSPDRVVRFAAFLLAGAEASAGDPLSRKDVLQ